jgi:MFS family permease
VSLSKSSPSTDATRPRFAAFTHRNFRLFWTGNLVSLIGTIAQQAAMGWLTRSLTSDPRFITFVAACGTLPFVVFSIYSGALADRTDKRRALAWVNTLSAFSALFLGSLVYFDLIRLWHVVLFALAAGIINSFDVPIRQSFNVEMVGREDLPSAIALNSTAFNMARVAGPAVGGFLIHQFSIAGCFLVNALSFVAIIVALAMMNLPPFAAQEANKVPLRGAALWRGVLFVRRHAVLKLVVLLVAAVSFLAMSFGTLVPIFARDVFHTDARGYTTLLTCNGLGALLAASSLAIASSMGYIGKRLLGGAFGFCVSTLAFAMAPTLWLASAMLIVSGFFLLTFLMAANTLVQTLSPDTLRGRVFALYSTALIGSTPLGAIVLGFLAKAIGPRLSVTLGCALAACIVFGIFTKHRSLWKQK